MKIYDTTASAISTTQTSAPTPAQQAGRSGKNERASSGQGDRVDLSGLSGQLSLEAADETGNAQKLSHLEAVVQSGGYQVNANAVSAGLIHQHTRA